MVMHTGDNLEFFLLLNNCPPIKYPVEEKTDKKETKKESAKETKGVKETTKPKVEDKREEEFVIVNKPAVEEDDMFGDIDEDTEEELREIKAQQAQAALALKRANKPKEVAKSTVVWDVKPTEAETDMAELEKSVRSITMEGLLWGSSKLQDVAYGVKKLVITSVVVDDLCSVDAIQEAIEAFDELIQSTDIVAFNKI